MRDGEFRGQRRNKELGPGFNFSFAHGFLHGFSLSDCSKEKLSETHLLGEKSSWG